MGYAQFSSCPVFFEVLAQDVSNQRSQVKLLECDELFLWMTLNSSARVSESAGEYQNMKGRRVRFRAENPLSACRFNDSCLEKGLTRKVECKQRMLLADWRVQVMFEKL